MKQRLEGVARAGRMNASRRYGDVVIWRICDTLPDLGLIRRCSGSPRTRTAWRLTTGSVIVD